MPDNPIDQLWTAEETARFLGVPLRTLHQWRYHNKGPEAYKVGRHLRYDPDIVRQWLTNECQHKRAA